MIPIKLTLEGIYSYQERQTIDFAELTSNGFFGILGGVGSGKSSILEAITYALYGETERLNRQDKRSYNMMNLKSDRMYIEFDFMNHENDIFRATREIKRNTKNFNDVRTPVVQFYKKIDDDGWIPLDHSNAESIIGLSYANFKRTIIIPQGQFKEFLELGPTERTNMMKDIFQLHRFDLQYKVSTLNSENKTKLDQIEGRLMEFESINEEDITKKKEDLSELTEQLDILKKEHDLLDERYQRLKSLKTDYINLQNLNAEFGKKQEQKETIATKQKQLETYERVREKFASLLADLDRENKQLIGLNNELAKESELLAKNTILLKDTKNSLDKIMPYYNQLGEKRKEESDLELIGQIQKFSADIATFADRTKKGKLEIERVEKALSVTINSINQEEESKRSLSKQKCDSKLLMELDSWYIQNDNNRKSVSQYEKALLEKQQELKKLLLEIKEKNIDIDNFKSLCNDAFTNLNNKEKQANDDKLNYELKQKMADYANALHDGAACPLCGSTEHPHVAGVEDMSHHLKYVADEIEKIKSEHEKWINYRTQAQRLYDKREELNKQIADADKKLKIEREIESTHLKLFVWDNFSPNNREEFEAKKKESLNIENQIEDKNKLIAKLRVDETNSRNNLKTYGDALEKFRREESELSTKIETNKSYLKVLSYDDYKNHEVYDINNSLLELNKKNNETEALYNKLNGDINNLDKILASQDSIVKSLNTRIDNTQSEVARLNVNLKKQLEEEKFDNIEEVQTILSQNIDIVSERDLINQFTLQFEILKNQISNLQIKLEEAQYDDSQFIKHEEAWTESKQKLSDYNNRVVELKAELDRLAKQYKEKLNLIGERNKLSKRADNLRLMFNLFKAQGFVQYVSSIYLAQLCNHANERFRRMTRNQLRLQINENNDFEIVDYLNEGRTRSVKTLSGGQSFQVSLSLALALAESVQSNAKAEKNFFFIDEGFGTQDLESVNIVFETLLNLNKENKIVGIISHVEELKERIPMTLTVIKDHERGSLLV